MQAPQKEYNAQYGLEYKALTTDEGVIQKWFPMEKEPWTEEQKEEDKLESNPKSPGLVGA